MGQLGNANPFQTPSKPLAQQLRNLPAIWMTSQESPVVKLCLQTCCPARQSQDIIHQWPEEWPSYDIQLKSITNLCSVLNFLTTSQSQQVCYPHRHLLQLSPVDTEATTWVGFECEWKNGRCISERGEQDSTFKKWRGITRWPMFVG
jgi:hypothetical protein